MLSPESKLSPVLLKRMERRARGNQRATSPSTPVRPAADSLDELPNTLALAQTPVLVQNEAVAAAEPTTLRQKIVSTLRAICYAPVKLALYVWSLLPSFKKNTAVAPETTATNTFASSVSSGMTTMYNMLPNRPKLTALFDLRRSTPAAETNAATESLQVDTTNTVSPKP